MTRVRPSFWVFNQEPLVYDFKLSNVLSRRILARGDLIRNKQSRFIFHCSEADRLMTHSLWMNLDITKRARSLGVSLSRPISLYKSLPYEEKRALAAATLLKLEAKCIYAENKQKQQNLVGG